MRQADIEVPNRAVNVDYRARPACYPRGSFYPLSPEAYHEPLGITKTCFRISPAFDKVETSEPPPFTFTQPAGRDQIKFGELDSSVSQLG